MSSPSEDDKKHLDSAQNSEEAKKNKNSTQDSGTIEEDKQQPIEFSDISSVSALESFERQTHHDQMPHLSALEIKEAAIAKS